jgi:hypothetical protein
MERGPSGRDPDMPTYEELEEAKRQDRKNLRRQDEYHREKERRYNERFKRGY